jgi:hypothetical protein
MALLNNDFKIKNGLTVNTTVSAGSCVEASCFIKHDGTSSQFLKADGSVDSTSYTTCLGDITAVTIEGALSGGGTAGDITIGLAASAAQGFDQSGCPGINCIGDITGVTDTAGLSTSGTSGNICIGIDATTAAGFDQSGCAGILCVGDITDVCTSTDYMTGGGASGSVEVGIDSACTSKWDSAASGGVQTLSAGDGIDDVGTATDPIIAVDTTVVRTIGDQTIAGEKTFTDDLRAEGDTDASTFYVSGSADSVGIGTDTPSEKLEVVGNVQVESGEFIGDLRGAVNFLAQAGENVATGEAVYISGISGNTTVVSLADADVVGEYPAFGIVAATASSGNPVTVVQFGDLGGLNTTQWGTEGTELYIGTTAGQLVSAAPTGEGAALQKIAKITRAHASTGSITIMGAGRSNAVPNLDTGNIFIGDGSNAPITASFDACLCATADARYIQGVTTNAGISGGGTSGTVTIGIDATTAAGFDQSGCPGINCIGTVTPSSADTFTNKSGSNNQWTNDAGYTTCTGDITGVTTNAGISGGGASGSVTIGIDATTAAGFDQSGCPGINCIGDITGVTDTAGLSTSGTSGTICIGLDATTANNLNQGSCPGINCVGTVTSVAGGDGIDSTGGTTPSIAVDSTVARTNVAETFTDNVTVQGDLTVNGDFTCINTVIETTSAIQVDNNGTGPALCVNQCGVNDVVNFLDDGTSVFYIEDGGQIGIGTTEPNSTLTVAGTISAQTSVTAESFVKRGGTSSQFLKADGSVDTTTYTTCIGDITEVCSSTLLSGGATSGVATIGIDSGALTYLDQGACPGINCVGDVTNVTNTAGLSTSGTSGTICIGLDASTAASLDQSGCAGIDCVGDITNVSSSTLLSGGGASGSVTLGIDSGALSYLDQSGCAGILCVGDITGVTDTAGLSTSGTSGNICIGIDATTAANFDQSGCAGILCIGTVTPSSSDTFTNKSGSNNQWTNDAAYTTCNGTITTAGTLLSGDSTTIGIDSGALTYLDQSGCSGLNCIGDVTNVTNTAGLSTSGTSGTICIGLDASTAASLDQSGCAGILCVGDITEVTTGVYLTGGGADGSVEIGIDSACTAAWDSAVAGGITEVTTTSLISGGGSSGSVEVGIDSGALAYLDQSGCAGILCVGDVTAVTTSTDYMTGGGLVGDLEIGIDSACTSKWDLATSGDISAVTATGALSGGGTSGDVCIGLDATAAANFDQSGCAGILCIGTTTASNSQTFTNKSGNISQWTNDSGFTSCTGTVTTAGTLLSGSASTIGVDSGALAYLDQSACAGILCVGDITGVTDTAGLSTSGTSGNICIGLDAATAASLDQSGCAGIDCVGTVTSVAGGDGISSTGGTTPSIAVDSTVVRTTGAQCVAGVKHFTDNLIVPTLSATGTIQANCFITGAFMEANVDVDKVYSQGIVLELDTRGCIVESTHPDSKMVFGVAAGNDEAPVVMGAEPICITGNICIGDYITTSDVPGHGKRSTQSYPYGSIIAQAMEDGSGESHSVKAMIRKM